MICQDCLCASPKADELFGLLPFTKNCINSALSTTVLAAVFIFTELHKILKDCSCQAKASIQNFLEVQPNNTLFLFMPSPVVENIIVDIMKTLLIVTLLSFEGDAVQAML